MVAWRYGTRVQLNIAYSFAALTREISSWPLEEKFPICARPCIIPLSLPLSLSPSLSLSLCLSLSMHIFVIFYPCGIVLDAFAKRVISENWIRRSSDRFWNLSDDRVSVKLRFTENVLPYWFSFQIYIYIYIYIYIRFSLTTLVSVTDRIISEEKSRFRGHKFLNIFQSSD